MKSSKIVVFLEIFILLGLLGYLLYWHLQVGLTRFFDVDEFTHLHTAANMAAGQKPYVDFFTFFTPGFYWMLIPLFWILGRSVAIFTAARVFMFVVFALMVALTGILFALLRNKRYALIPMVILAFLPMPFDKYMEIRPDNVAALLGLLGVVLQVYGMLHPEHKRRILIWFAAGVSYSASLVVLVKTLPFGGMGVAVAALDAGFFEWLGFMVKRKRIVAWKIAREYWMFAFGLAAPLVLLFLYFLALGHFSTVWYSLTKLPFEANMIGHIYIMEPHLFFFPNASFYGGWGITRPLITNHTLWFIGIIVGCMRLLTPFIAAGGDRKRTYAELLVAGIFALSVYGYVVFFPLKHSQYLIPIAIFIAWYAADFIGSILMWIRRHAGDIGVLLVLILFAILLGQDTIQVNSLKLTMSNTVQLSQTKTLLSMVPPQSRVLDLDGRMMFWKDAYYICCLPFGEFVRFLSRPPAPLGEALEDKKVPYIYQGDSGRLWELADFPYIKDHYTRVPGWGDALWRRNGSE